MQAFYHHTAGAAQRKAIPLALFLFLSLQRRDDTVQLLFFTSSASSTTTPLFSQQPLQQNPRSQKTTQRPADEVDGWRDTCLSLFSTEPFPFFPWFERFLYGFLGGHGVPVCRDKRPNCFAFFLLHLLLHIFARVILRHRLYNPLGERASERRAGSFDTTAGGARLGGLDGRAIRGRAAEVGARGRRGF